MSPVWIKLGDFGVSKRILAQATTTLHTQVLTQVYSAPEVLGLDSNSETSDYTNSVDIWLLGCVIYELLVGTKLFVSEFQLYRYFYGIWPFPEDRIRGVSPLADDIGISLLKAMLSIQPEDRPTAGDALSHAWLADLKCDNEHSGDDGAETIQSGNRSMPSRKRESRPATDDGPRGGKSRGYTITQDDTKCTRGGVALGSSPGSRGASDLATAKAPIDTFVMEPLDASTEISAVQMGPQIFEPMLPNLSGPHLFGPSGKKHVCDTPPCLKSDTPNTSSTFIQNMLLTGTGC